MSSYIKARFFLLSILLLITVITIAGCGGKTYYGRYTPGDAGTFDIELTDQKNNDQLIAKIYEKNSENQTFPDAMMQTYKVENGKIIIQLNQSNDDSANLYFNIKDDTTLVFTNSGNEIEYKKK